MKKLLLILLCVIIIFISSCYNNKIKNVNFEQIDDECEVVEVFNMMFLEAIEYHDKYGKDIEDMPKHIQSRIKNILLNISSFEQYTHKFNGERFQLCPNYTESNRKLRFLETMDWWVFGNDKQNINELGDVNMDALDEEDIEITRPEDVKPPPPPSISVDY